MKRGSFAERICWAWVPHRKGEIPFILGVEIGIRLTLLAANQCHSIANNRLRRVYATVRAYMQDDLAADRELAIEVLHQKLEKIMGEGWDR